MTAYAPLSEFKKLKARVMAIAPDEVKPKDTIVTYADFMVRTKMTRDEMNNIYRKFPDLKVKNALGKCCINYTEYLILQNQLR